MSLCAFCIKLFNTQNVCLCDLASLAFTNCADQSDLECVKKKKYIRLQAYFKCSCFSQFCEGLNLPAYECLSGNFFFRLCVQSEKKVKGNTVN